MSSWAGIEKALKKFNKKGFKPGKLTPGELIEAALKIDVRLSDVVIAESIIETGWSIEEFFNRVLCVFDHNLKALDLGLKKGRSFLLDCVACDLAACGLESGAVLDDSLINRAIIYTLATEESFAHLA